MVYILEHKERKITNEVISKSSLVKLAEELGDLITII